MGAHLEGSPNCYAIDVEEILLRFILNVFFLTFCNQIAQTGTLFAQYQYFDHFDPKNGIFDTHLA